MTQHSHAAFHPSSPLLIQSRSRRLGKSGTRRPRRVAASSPPSHRPRVVSTAAASPSSSPWPPSSSVPTWNTYANCQILLPPAEPQCLLIFLPGFGASVAPSTAYGALLTSLCTVLNAAVVAHRTALSQDHLALARDIALHIPASVRQCEHAEGISLRSLPAFGLAHSLGAKLLLLLFSDPTSRQSLSAFQLHANILMAFCNASARSASPIPDGVSEKAVDALQSVRSFLSSVDLSLIDEPDANDTRDRIVNALDGMGNALRKEFDPSPDETLALIAARYSIRSNLLIRYSNDSLDHTNDLFPVLKSRFGPQSTLLRELTGTHLTPMTPDFESGDFTSLGDMADQFVERTASKVSAELKESITNVAAYVKLQRGRV